MSTTLIGPQLPRGYRRVPDHGTYSRYVIFKCRCDMCRDAVNTYRRRQNRLRGYAGRTLVATSEESNTLRRRVRALIEDHGWHQKALALEAGMPHETFQGWYAGRKKNPRLANLTAIETMLDRIEGDPAMLSPGRLAARTVDRLNVLNGMGWTLKQIGDVAGTGANLAQVVNGRQLPRPVTITKIDRAWEQLTGRGPKPPRQNLKGRASQRVKNQPTATTEPPPRRGPAHYAEAVDLIERVQALTGHTTAEIADRAGITSRTLRRILAGASSTVHDDTMTALEEVAHQEGIYVA